MTEALSWLNDLANWLARWFPRPVLIEASHRGVRFGPRGGVQEVGPGLIIYWPIAYSLVQVPIATQSIQLYTQMLPADDVRLADVMIPRVRFTAAAIQFRVIKPALAAVKALSIHALVDNRAQAAIARNPGDDAEAWSAKVVRQLGDELEAYGVAIERLDFTQNGTGVAIKQLEDWHYSDSTDGKRPS